MKKAITIVLSLVLFAACTTRDKNSVFLWKYTTKAELYGAGFKPVHTEFKSPITKEKHIEDFKDWLEKQVADTTVYYSFNNDVLLNKMISVERVTDSSGLYKFLNTIGFTKNKGRLVYGDSVTSYKIRGGMHHFVFTQDYNKDTRLIRTDSTSTEKK